MHRLGMMMLLIAVVNHSVNSGGGSAHLELWQVINLVGSIVFATMLLPPVLDDLRRWRRG